MSPHRRWGEGDVTTEGEIGVTKPQVRSWERQGMNSLDALEGAQPWDPLSLGFWPPEL